MYIVCVCVCVQLLSYVWLFATQWTVAHQAALSMELSRQEYRSVLSFPTPVDLPDQKIESVSAASPELAGRFFITRTTCEDHMCESVCVCVCMPFECLMKHNPRKEIGYIFWWIIEIQGWLNLQFSKVSFFFCLSLHTFIHYLNISVVSAANFESLFCILKACH